jgi:hypothetical protein
VTAFCLLNCIESFRLRAFEASRKRATPDQAESQEKSTEFINNYKSFI